MIVSCQCSKEDVPNSECDPFFINYTFNQIATLSIKEEIDYEVTHLITCEIDAIDLNAFTNDSIATQTQDNSIRFSIEILNENDNIPIPDKSLYIFNVSENTPIESSFGQIEASDVDEDEIQFSLQSEFNAINSNGVLLLKNQLDYEERGFMEK